MGVWTSYQASHNRFKQPVYKDEQKWQKWRIELTSGLKQPLFRNPQLLRLQVPNHDLVMFFQKFQSIAVPMAQIYLICVANIFFEANMCSKYDNYHLQTYILLQSCELQYEHELPCLANKGEWSPVICFQGAELG